MRNLEEPLDRILQNLGISKAVNLKEKANILRNFLCNTYGETFIGKVKVRGESLVVEIKSATLRNELFMKKVELLDLLKKNGVVDLPKDIEFVGRL